MLVSHPSAAQPPSPPAPHGLAVIFHLGIAAFALFAFAYWWQQDRSAARTLLLVLAPLVAAFFIVFAISDLVT